MNRTLLMYGIVAVVLISVVVTTFNIFVNPEGEMVTEEQQVITTSNVVITENDEELQIEETTSVKKEISRLHSLLNQTVGWNGYRTFNWESGEDSIATMQQKVDVIKANTEDVNLKQDMAHMMASIMIGVENKDADGLIYAHRIIHDLDYFVNGANSDGVIYNVTNFGNDSNIHEVVNYITD